MSNGETDHDKVIRLDEKLLAASEALKLAHANEHAIRAEVISVAAIFVSLYVFFKQ